MALVLAVFMVGYVVRVADRLTAHSGALPAPAGCAATGSPPGRPYQAPRYLAPRCAALCKIAMGITMGYMLILML